MLPTFHTDFEHIFVAYISIHLLFCKCSLISSRRKKKHNSDTKHIVPQDQTYCFNYLIAQKLETQISQKKILLIFHSILTFCAKRNAHVAMDPLFSKI